MPRFPKNLRRYHKDVYFPGTLAEMLREFVGQFRASENSQDPEPTHHAAEQLLEDRKALNYNVTIPLPTRLELFDPSNTLVEFYEVLDKNNTPTGRIQKALIRIHNLHEHLDYTYVVAREGFIVSAWANDKGDEHRLTESGTEYYTPEREPV